MTWCLLLAVCPSLQFYNGITEQQLCFVTKIKSLSEWAWGNSKRPGKVVLVLTTLPVFHILKNVAFPDILNCVCTWCVCAGGVCVFVGQNEK